MIKILFVCHGNICRSPMAEFVLKDMVEKRHLENLFEIASAATSTEEIWGNVGNPVYPPARKELAKHGISCEGKRAVQVTKADYEHYDYLICMDSMNLRNLKYIIGKDVQGKVSLCWITRIALEVRLQIPGIREIFLRHIEMLWTVVKDFWNIF